METEGINKLLELRKAYNLSQEELAEKIGVSRQAVSKWERGEASPDTDNLILLSRLYNISLDELIGTQENTLETAEAVDETEVVQEPEKIKRKKRFFTKKKVIILFSSLAFILVASTAYVFLINPLIKYQSAVACIKNKYYAGALQNLDGIEHFLDSKEKIVEAKYGRAQEYMDNREYSYAFSLYNEIADYKDSKKRAEKLKKCEITAMIDTKINENSIKVSLYSNLVDGSLVNISLVNIDRLKSTYSTDSLLIEYVTIQDGKAEKTITVPEVWGTCNFKVLSSCEFGNQENPQPQNVAELYGENGQNLYGEFIKTATLGGWYVSFREITIAYPSAASVYNADTYKKILDDNEISESLIPLYKIYSIEKVTESQGNIVIVFTNNSTYSETFNYYKKYMSSRGQYLQQPYDNNLDMLTAPLHDIKRSLSVLVAKGLIKNDVKTEQTSVTIMLSTSLYYQYFS